MYRFLKNLFYLLILSFVFSSCRKKAFDEFYNPPANAQPPIYQVLQARGNFKNILALIDKGGYKATLSAAGYWTFFAPNDAAFQKYFQENNTSLDKISAADAKKLVMYCLVYNAFKTNHIADYQSSSAKGWVPGEAFKRRTSYSDGPYKGLGPDGDSTVLLSSNRNGNGTPANFSFGDDNNKYIPYFYSTYMDSHGLTAADYNYFYPNTTYTGFNVVNSSVVNRDIIAQNGVIDEVDQVIMPLPSLEQKLAQNPNYSVFKQLYDQFMISYLANADATHQYQVLNHSTSNVYIKQYSNLLAFSPNNENYLKLEDNDGQSDGYSMFVPTNDALTPYLNSVILEFYKNISALPLNIIADLLNAHMWQGTVWPSKFALTNNYLGEPARFDKDKDINERLFCSNGVFYGTNKPQAANVFSTVYARAYLDPAYSYMTLLLNMGLKPTISNPGLRYTVFALPNTAFQALGYNYDPVKQIFTLTVNGSTSSGTAVNNGLLRILNLNTASTPNNELNDLSGDGIIETNAGEYIRWHNYKVSSGGTVEQNATLTVDQSKTRDYVNGRVYFLTSGLLDAPVKTVGADILANAGTSTAPYYDFYQYLINSSAYNPTAGDIIGLQLGGNYTVLVPTQAAMKQAVIDGYLPGVTAGSGSSKTFVSFTYNPSDPAAKDLVSHFIYNHILGITIAPDGKRGGTAVGTEFPTLLKDINGDIINVLVFSTPGTLKFQDYQGRVANITAPNNNSYFPATSNYLGNHTLLHQIDNYLQYDYDPSN